jgi:hypothetical protein
MSKEKELLSKFFGEEKAKELETQLANDETDMDEIVSELTNTQKSRFYEIAKNDNAFIDDLVSPVVGKMTGTIDSRLKRFGVDPEAVKGKSVAEKFDILENAYNDKIKNAGKQEAAQLQEELVSLNKKIEQYETEEIPKIREQVEVEKNEFRVGNKLSTLYANIDNSSLVTGKEGREASIKLLDFIVKGKYDIKINEAGETEFYLKGSNQKVMNAEKTKLLIPKEIIKQELIDNGLYRQSNGQSGAGSPPPTPPINTGAGNRTLSSVNEELKKELEKANK